MGETGLLQSDRRHLQETTCSISDFFYAASTFGKYAHDFLGHILFRSRRVYWGAAIIALAIWMLQCQTSISRILTHPAHSFASSSVSIISLSRRLFQTTIFSNRPPGAFKVKTIKLFSETYALNVAPLTCARKSRQLAFVHVFDKAVFQLLTVRSKKIRYFFIQAPVFVEKNRA